MTFAIKQKGVVSFELV